eukprot:2447078-Rhodomonas_salina.1
MHPELQTFSTSAFLRRAQIAAPSTTSVPPTLRTQLAHHSTHQQGWHDLAVTSLSPHILAHLLHSSLAPFLLTAPHHHHMSRPA